MALELGVRRRGTLQQGQALEMLGHAVEYLVDQRLFALTEQDRANDSEAAQTLMQLSRAVFLECPEVIPVSRQIASWWSSRFPRFTAGFGQDRQGTGGAARGPVSLG
jgi:hypothetical protein